jgi:hypothetical protein
LSSKKTALKLQNPIQAVRKTEEEAIKIFTEASPFLKAYIKPFGTTEIRMLTNGHLSLTTADHCATKSYLWMVVIAFG